MRKFLLWLASVATLLLPFATGLSQSSTGGRTGALPRGSGDLEVQDFARLERAKPVWEQVCQKTNSRPAIAGDQVILLERMDRGQERVRSFRLSTGEPTWEHRYPAPLPAFFDDEFGWGPHAAPAVAGQTVIVAGVTGIVWALDLKTGRPRWRRDLWKEFATATPLERGLAASPVVEAGQVIVPVGGRGAGVVALDLQTGRTRWTSGDFTAAYTTPVVGELAGQRQVVVLLHEVLAGLDPSTGRVLWETPFVTPNSVHVASPLILDGQFVLAGSSGGTRLYEVARQSDRWKATEAWRTTRSTPQVGNFVRVQEQIIAPSSGGPGSLTTCLRWRDGSLVWKERFGGRGSLVELRDGLLTLNDSGDLEVRRLAGTSVTPAIRLPGFAASPQWGAPAFGKDVMVLQTGDRLQAWRLGSAR